jgi:hypothetical protein
MDEHVPRVITAALRRRGVDVLTAQEDGRRHTPDPEVLDRATQLGRVTFTLDYDFLKEATRRQRSGISFRGVVFAHGSKVSIGACIHDLESVAKASEPEDWVNRVEYLPL